MLNVISLILICVTAIPALSQSTSQYQVGTITSVQPHKGTAESDPSTAGYEVSLKIGNAVYVVLYTPPSGIETVRYATGRELLVLVGKQTVTFNDILGNSSEVPILSQSATGTQSSPTSAAQSNNPANVGPQQQAPIKSTEIIGLAGVKEKTEGTLTIEDGKLYFAHSGAKSDVAVAAMEDVVTANDSQRAIRGTLGTLSMFGPYGSGRVLSMFRSNVDCLTIKYRDDNGGLHGVVFTMPVGTAESFKQELVAQGAHTTIPAPTNASVDSSRQVAVEAKQ